MGESSYDQSTSIRDPYFLTYLVSIGQKKKLSLFIVMLALIGCVLNASAQKLEGLTLLPDGSDMLKYGQPDIDLPADTLLETFDLGDIVTVTIEGYDSFDVPVCSNYDDVFMGEKLLRTVPGKTQLCLAINYGQLGVELGIVQSVTVVMC